MEYLIILITLIYASLGSITQTNFTGIANEQGYSLFFLVWTILIASYFFSQSKKIFQKFHFSFKGMKILSIYIYIACLITPLIPYTKNSELLNELHVFFAMSSSCLFIGIWIAFLFHLSQIYPNIHQKIQLPFRLMVVTLIGCTFFFGCINSLVELLLVISMILLIKFLKKI